ncbi:MAG: chain-length determining protein [Parabacteroides sp.]|nr:chain-length determining protein [Parabacteroides sp.]
MENEQLNTSSSSGQEIDLVELARKLWQQRRFIFKACGIGAVLGLVVAFSLPKEYKTEVKLSPENSQGNRMGQLGGLAAMAGINLGSGAAGEDALSVELYPDIVQSTPFLLEFISMPVETQNGTLRTTLYDYLTEHQRSPWWGHITGAPFRLLGWTVSLFKDSPSPQRVTEIDSFRLTAEQESFINSLRQKIMVQADKKTGAITGSVVMQDPLVSALVMDSVLSKLQQYVIDYRTQKSRHDLVFTEKLYGEAKAAYYQAQQAYARYTDENRNVISARSMTEEERLKNEMDLAYNVYNQMAQQLEMNRVKVQEHTPVYMVIEPAKVSLGAYKPNKIMILIGFVFFLFFLTTGYILLRGWIPGFDKTGND